MGIVSPEGRERDAVHAGGVEGKEDDAGEDDDGEDGGLVAEGQAVDDVGGCRQGCRCESCVR
eukprot:3333133-Rhodomonas_salina.1